MPIQHCVRPLFVQSDHPDYPVYVSASGILGRLGERAVVLTAHHVLFPGEASPENPDNLKRALLHTTLVDPDRFGAGLLIFSNLHCGTITSGGKATTFSDLALFIVDKKQSRVLNNLLPFYDEVNGGCMIVPDIKEKFFIYGYTSPASKPLIDYENKTIDAMPLEIVGYFSGWEDDVPGIGKLIIDEIRYRDQIYTDTLDGISGSPVFVKRGTAYGLAGMVISAGGNMIRFISSFIIRELFKRRGFIPKP